MSTKSDKPTPKTIASAATLSLNTTTIAGSSSPIKPVKKKVTELTCSEIRWFYEKTGDNKWTPFRGLHSNSSKWDTFQDMTRLRWNSRIELSTTFRWMHERRKWSANSPFRKRSHSSTIFTSGTSRTSPTWSHQFTGKTTTSKFDEALGSTPISHWKRTLVMPLKSTIWRNSEIKSSPIRRCLASMIAQRDQVNHPIVTFQIVCISVLTQLKWGHHDEVQWNSVIDVLFYNNTKANRMLRFVTRAKGVYHLKRGYSVEADIDDGRPDFSDLILVIHGIGQKGYENLIAKNTSQIREAVESLMAKNYPNEKRRPMILPIEWRSALKLDGELTDTITLPRMLGFRSTLNSVAMDIMYYQSPLYRQEIINGVTKCLNETYSKFIQSHPKFTGPVSIFAHSLGSVIAYDVSHLV